MHRKGNYIFIFFILVAFTSIRIFSFVLIPDTIFDYIELLIFFLIIISYIYLTIINNAFLDKNHFGKYIYVIIILTLFSSIPAKLFHGQSYYLSFLISRTAIYWMVYFILLRLNIINKKLEMLLVFIGIVWASIMVIQQITFPTVYFNMPTVFFNYFSDTDIEFVRKLAEERAGIVRVMIMGIPYAYFLVFYSWVELNKNFKISMFLIFTLTLVALSLTGSRQIIFAVILIIAIDFLFNSKFQISKKIIIVVFLAIIMMLTFTYIDRYFQSLIEVTKSQNILSDDYIRVQAINYFLYEFYPSPFCFLFGNGWEHSLSLYGQEMMNKIYYRSDVGLIGALNKFGLFYVLTILLIYWKILVPKSFFNIPHSIRLLFIFLFLTSFTGANYFEEPDSVLFFVFIFYIIEKYNENSIDFNSHPQPVEFNKKRIIFSIQSIKSLQ